MNERANSPKVNCEQISELLADYLQGSLGRGQGDLVEQHLRDCAACRESVALWNKLALLPQEEPSPALRARFEAMMLAYQEARGGEAPRIAPVSGKVILLPTPGWQRWAMGVAAAIVLLVVGFSAGRYTGAKPPEGSAAAEIDGVRGELAQMRQLVVLSMLQQQSAGERLQGIALTTQQGQGATDPKVLEALLRALRFDSNVAVRLAALDALSTHGKQPIVQTGLIEALQPQQSPLVQVALIDMLVEHRDKTAIHQLQSIRQNTQLNPSVRQRAEWAIGKLSTY